MSEPALAAKGKPLAGCTAIVTGAAGGLARGIVLSPADAGAVLGLIDLPSAADPLMSLAHDVSRAGGQAIVETADITSEQTVAASFDHITRSLQPAEILVNAAGVTVRKPALEMSIAEWCRVVDVNVTGTWLTSCAAARVMKAQGLHGRIINLASQYIDIVGPFAQAAYYTSKAAVANLTRALAAEWAPLGIRVNCLAPGPFYPTHLTAELEDERLQSLRSRTLLKRLGDPLRDLGAAVMFLAAGGSEYITGTVLHVDGGWSAW